MSVAVVIVCLVAWASAALAYRGEGTAYSAPFDMDATGTNMCEFKATTLPRQWQQFYAALSQNEWESNGMYDVCGRCIRACGTEKDAGGRCVVAMVVDQCPDWACNSGNVDFSTVAMEGATGYDWDRKEIEWDFVECSSTTTKQETQENQKMKMNIAAADMATDTAITELISISDDATEALDNLNTLTTR